MRQAPIFITHPLGAYEDQSAAAETQANEADELVIPEDLTSLDDEALNALHARAVSTFQGMYGDGTDINDDDLTALAALTDGIEALSTERGERSQRATERAEKARALAAKVNPEGTLAADSSEDSDDDEGDSANAEAEDSAEGTEDGDEDEAESDDSEDPAPQTVTAAAQPVRRSELRIDTSRVKRHLPSSTKEAATMRDVTFAAGDGTGYSAGQGIDWSDAGKIVDRRLATFNQTAYASAAARGRHMRQQMGVMSIRKPIPDDLVIMSNDSTEVEDVLRRAANESRLEGNSLVASGGWCAPSETLYGLLELETRDGLFSLPEVGIARGGISRTLGPSFADIYEQIGGFHYTEAEDIAGDYDGEGGGSKPCYKVDCPPFEEFRLEVDGLCITAGLLQQRGYPEVIARTIRGALIAHDHRMSGRILREIREGSEEIIMAGDVSGTIAPLLEAIELQAEHVRYSHRLARGTSLEAVFPFWVRGAIRADLSRRQGVDLISVPDSRIDAWFRERGIAPQFVYNWQDINPIAADAFTGWPTEVEFLMYPAGSWIRGSADIITVDTLFDSTQLGTNDYTALFTEEGYLVVPMGHDSRVITVPIISDGATHIGVDFTNPGVTIPEVTATHSDDFAINDPEATEPGDGA